jgi:selenocysteine-specific elongation factor
MRVIGTAGHVDHGKSTLVKQLTGIDPDRLREEKQRALTIDLGFAWFDLPSGETVGLVDVPGHRDFIENMLAGVGGIDAAMLVIAADEGVMPQTREHLAILDLLGIEHGMIALTKTDLVDDLEWLELVRMDVRDTLAHTALNHVSIVPLSARTGQGFDSLRTHLDALLATAPPQVNYHRPRLPVDRVFTVEGFGTVVTGTLTGGTLHVSDTVEIQPGGLDGRIRGLQSYNQTVETAYPGSRVAVNIAGVDKGAVKRGDVLAYPGQIQSTVLADVHYRHLASASRPLKHNATVKVFCGAAEAVANIRLLDADMLPPGESGWLQLRLTAPLALTAGDRYILRFPSPAETIGGGVIVRATPGRRWKRFRPEIVQQLDVLMQGTPEERLEQLATQPIHGRELQQRAALDDVRFQKARDDALQHNLLVLLGDDRLLATRRLDDLIQKIRDVLHGYHTEHPLKVGMPREELRSRLKLEAQFLTQLLSQQTVIQAKQNILYLADHAIAFNAKQQKRVDQLMSQMQSTTPPNFEEAAAIVGEDVLYALIETKVVVQVKPGVIFAQAIYEHMVAGTLELIDRDGDVDARTLRDEFDTSRKYAIALLEHLDANGITRRIDDRRVRG